MPVSQFLKIAIFLMALLLNDLQYSSIYILILHVNISILIRLALMLPVFMSRKSHLLIKSLAYDAGVKKTKTYSSINLYPFIIIK